MPGMTLPILALLFLILIGVPVGIVVLFIRAGWPSSPSHNGQRDNRMDRSQE